MSDLSQEKLSQFLKLAVLKKDSIPNALTKLGLLKNKKLINAAGLFFAKNPPVKLRCAVFAGTTSSTIIDRHDFEDDILVLIEEAQKYILKNIHMGMKLKGLYREDIPEISIDAIRESIINAFCHRDYRDSDQIQIAIFKDRVEIRSPGKLFDGMTIQEMLKGNLSRRRNPIVADMLRRIQMVEAWGRGIPLILEKEPTVKFEVAAKIFITNFTRPSFQNVAKIATPKTLGKTPGKTPGIILMHLAQNPSYSIPSLAEKMGKSESAIERAIRKLKAEGRLRRIGPDSSGHWQVME